MTYATSILGGSVVVSRFAGETWDLPSQFVAGETEEFALSRKDDAELAVS